MNYNYRQSLLCLFCLVGALALPSLTEAQFTPLVGVPGLGTTDNFSQYINALYTLSISVAALLAVIKMIIAGMKYMLSDVVTTKQDALGDIKGAVGGLVIVISAVLVLQVINPQIVSLNVFNNISATQAPPKTSGVAPVGSSGNSFPSTIGPSLPLPKKVTCTVTGSQNNSLTLSNACVNGTDPFGPLKGRHTVSNNMFGQGCTVTCEYGNSNNITCSNDGLSNNWDCEASILLCQSTGGTPHTSAGGATVTCIKPF